MRGLVRRRLSRLQAWSIVGSLVLAATAAVQLVWAGDTRTVVILLAVAPLLVVAIILLTRRSMARGKSAPQIIDQWFHIPVVGPFLRFADRVNSRMGRGSKELLEDSRRRGGSSEDGDDSVP